MDEPNEYTELVRRAQLGDEKSLAALTRSVRGRLYAYVYRIVLDDHLAQDVVQETLLEMFKVLGKLEKADRFWPWLRAIAFNKVRRHHSREKQRRASAMADTTRNGSKIIDKNTGLASLVAEELKQVVIGAMAELKPRHRKVLTMRCYEDMDYSEIAELMGCSELSARVLFCRAKRSLEKQLSRRGFSRGFLVTALLVFGKVTAPSKAAAAGVNVTAATTSAGVTAGLLALAGTKTAAVSVAAAGVIAVGTVAVTVDPSKSTVGAGMGSGAAQSLVQPYAGSLAGARECWFYYPLSVDGPVMMRLMQAGNGGNGAYCRWWQDSNANHSFDADSNKIVLKNRRMYRGDLAVMRLPTDDRALIDFISRTEGRNIPMDYISGNGSELLVIARKEAESDLIRSQVLRHPNMLREEYFRYKWPPGATVDDQRDPMHARGWAYFRVSGSVNGEQISGYGQIPFVFDSWTKRRPWLRLSIGRELTIADSSRKTCVYDSDGDVIAAFRSGVFLAGMSRPWTGLHTVDIIRRDAARSRIPFETAWNANGEECLVTLTTDRVVMTYAIDMETDVVRSIAFTSADGSSQISGRLEFTYYQSLDEVPAGFAPPAVPSAARARTADIGITWLEKLALGTLKGELEK